MRAEIAAEEARKAETAVEPQKDAKMEALEKRLVELRRGLDPAEAAHADRSGARAGKVSNVLDRSADNLGLKTNHLANIADFMNNPVSDVGGGGALSLLLPNVDPAQATAQR